MAKKPQRGRRSAHPGVRPSRRTFLPASGSAPVDYKDTATLRVFISERGKSAPAMSPVSPSSNNSRSAPRSRRPRNGAVALPGQTRRRGRPEIHEAHDLRATRARHVVPPRRRRSPSSSVPPARPTITCRSSTIYAPPSDAVHTPCSSPPRACSDHSPALLARPDAVSWPWSSLAPMTG